MSLQDLISSLQTKISSLQRHLQTVTPTEDSQSGSALTAEGEKHELGVLSQLNKMLGDCTARLSNGGETVSVQEQAEMKQASIPLDPGAMETSGSTSKLANLNDQPNSLLSGSPTPGGCVQNIAKEEEAVIIQNHTEIKQESIPLDPDDMETSPTIAKSNKQPIGSSLGPQPPSNGAQHVSMEMARSLMSGSGKGAGPAVPIKLSEGPLVIVVGAACEGTSKDTQTSNISTDPGSSKAELVKKKGATGGNKGKRKGTRTSKRASAKRSTRQRGRPASDVVMVEQIEEQMKCDISLIKSPPLMTSSQVDSQASASIVKHGSTSSSVDCSATTESSCPDSQDSPDDSEFNDLIGEFENAEDFYGMFDDMVESELSSQNADEPDSAVEGTAGTVAEETNTKSRFDPKVLGE